MIQETLGYAVAGVKSCAGRASNRQPSEWLTFKRLILERYTKIIIGLGSHSTL
jgi:hypothetical protein